MIETDSRGSLQGEGSLKEQQVKADRGTVYTRGARVRRIKGRDWQQDAGENPAARQKAGEMEVKTENARGDETFRIKQETLSIVQIIAYRYTN